MPFKTSLGAFGLARCAGMVSTLCASLVWVGAWMGVGTNPAQAQTSPQQSSSSPLAPPTNGPRRSDPSWLALTDCTVHVKAGEVVSRAVVVIKDGRIQAVLAGSPGPDGNFDTDDDVPARVPIGPALISAKGMHVYPAFIDAYVEVDAPAPPARGEGRSGAGSHWNDAITPQRRALDGAGIDESLAKSLRELGFGAAAISPKGGNMRGQSSVVSLARPANWASGDKPPVYRADVYQTMSFETGGRGYPDSQMGAIALVRQVLSDAVWLSQGGSSGDGDVASCLRFLAPEVLREQWMVFDAGDELEALRADRVWTEFAGLAPGNSFKGLIVLGSGTEYARLDAIKQAGHAMIVPLNFPKAPDVSSPGKADSVELRDMMRWEQAPTNPRRLAAAGVEFALTTSKLRGREAFLGHVRSAIAHGWSSDAALAALTSVPAKLLGVDDQLGSVEAGKRANLIIASGLVFDKKTTLRSLLVDGVMHELEKPKVDLSGTWRLEAAPDDAVRSLLIDSDGTVTVVKVTPAAEGKGEPTTVKVKARKVVQESNTLTYVFDHDELGQAGVASVAMVFDLSSTPATASGRVALPGGEAGAGRQWQFAATRDARSLAGDWPVTFETPVAERQTGPVVRVSDAPALARERVPVVEVRTFDETGQHTSVQARRVSWDGTSLSYELTSEDLGGQMPGVRVTATLDKDAKPALLRGRVESEQGSVPFVARLLSDAATWWKGTWTVVRRDGQSITPTRNDQVQLQFGDKSLTIVVTKAGAPEVSIDAKDVTFEGSTISFTHDLTPLGGQGQSKDVLVRVGAELRGTATLPDGSTHTYSVRMLEEPKTTDDDESPKDVPELLPIPFGPYGLLAQQPQSTFLISNVDVWTNDEGPADEAGNIGFLPGATVLLQGGIIKLVAPTQDDLKVRLPGDTISIDGTGKVLTAGIIDAHSHTGISRGVNEGGQAVTAEVRIGDVTNPDDVDWYRQLASGVTSVLQLHGSANAIGGQSQTTKLRWGVSRPEQMHFERAASGIKFALGENPKQVNWDANTTRYPKTRMGVEMLIRDRFSAAQEYAKARSEPAQGPGVRRDLELDALAEILTGQRLVHCHSYRQDEIVMLAMVAKDFGFRIGTYQHILEGYKVADYVRDYSGGGSGFADWWAFKVEVQDAIPAGLPLMQKVGATTSFNSDSDNLARFLNVEAAKAVKYGREVGGFSASEAWQFVTLNPAKQLKIDGQVGRVKEGYDADVVLWSGNPLSTMTRVERTWVDGRELYSIEQDQSHRLRIAQERERLINKLLKDSAKAKKPKKDANKDAGSASTSASGAQKPDADETSDAVRALSDVQREQLRQIYLEQLRSGRDPRFMPGVCGCGWHIWD